MPIVKYDFDSNFVRLHNDVARDNRLSFEARGVLAYLLSRSPDWNPCFSDIAEQGGLGIHKTRRIMAELEAAGYIKKSQPRTSGGARFASSITTVYGLPFTGPKAIESREVCADSPHAENQLYGDQHKSDDYCVTETCMQKTVIRKPSALKKENKRKTKRKTTSSDDDGTFDQFWAMWPKKKAKQDAIKAWRKVKDKPATLELIRANLEMHANAGDWAELQYVPNPATYINGARWEDAVYEKSKRSNAGDKYAHLAESYNDTSWAD